MLEEYNPPKPDSSPDDYSMPGLIGLAKTTRIELNRFKEEVLKHYELAKRHQCRWVTGYQAAKMLSVTDRTLRRYRLKYNIRISTINGICRYYYPDLLALLKEPAQKKIIKSTNQGKTYFNSH